MSRAMRWTTGFVVLAGIGAAVAWLVLDAYGNQAEGGGGESAAESAPRLGHPGGTVEIVLSAAAVESAGVRTEPLAAATYAPEVVAYGSIQEDPSRSFMLRAPLAGVVRGTSGATWPAVGARLVDGVTVGTIEPRFAPAEKVDLASRLVTARGERESAMAELGAARSALERARTLNAEDHNISDRVLQEAEVAVETAQARLREATDTVRLLDAALVAGSADAGMLPIVVERGGDVVEVFVQPGEAVESGQPILRTVRFDRVVARVNVPAGEAVAEPISALRVVAVGAEDQPLRAESIGPAPSFDAEMPGRTLLFSVDAGAAGLRPGASITAYLRAAGEPQSGVVVPRSAVVRTGGRAWAWVAAGRTFARREVPLGRPIEQGWFVTAGFAAGEQVVVVGAQALLSAELSAGNGGEE
jgi:hypothetical protein